MSEKQEPLVTEKPDLSMEDVAFLMDMDGGGGLCFHEIHQEGEKQSNEKPDEVKGKE